MQEMQEIQERPCGAMEKALCKGGVSRENQASKPLNFQPSNYASCVREHVARLCAPLSSL